MHYPYNGGSFEHEEGREFVDGVGVIFTCNIHWKIFYFLFIYFFRKGKKKKEVPDESTTLLTIVTTPWLPLVADLPPTGPTLLPPQTIPTNIWNSTFGAKNEGGGNKE